MWGVADDGDPGEWETYMSMRARRISVASSAFLISIGVVVAGAPAYAADGPACGDVITTDTVLTADLVCDASTDGLVIAADGVTLDLGGHTISGPGAYATSFAAVRATGRAHVTVTNGIVTGYQAGVVLNETWDSTVSKLSVTENDQGVNLAGGGRHLVTQNSVSQNGRDGIRLGLSTGNAVTQNVLDGNTWGISVADFSSNNVISRNAVSNSRSNGLGAFGGAMGTSFQQNTVTASWSDGIAVAGDTSGTTLSQNKSNGNGGNGFTVSKSAVVKNTAVNNAGHGIVAAASTDGGGNKAAGNLMPPQCVGVVCSAP